MLSYQTINRAHMKKGDSGPSSAGRPWQGEGQPHLAQDDHGKAGGKDAMHCVHDLASSKARPWQGEGQPHLAQDDHGKAWNQSISLPALESRQTTIKPFAVLLHIRVILLNG